MPMTAAPRFSPQSIPFATAGRTDVWKKAIDDAVDIDVDAVIIADIGMAGYVAKNHPEQRIHLSVQAGASSPEAINFYGRTFGIKRVVLPRILTVAEIKKVHDEIGCEIEVFIFGNIGMMAEGRCLLTNYVTGQSTNMDGVCSPASHVYYEEDRERNLTTRLGDFAIDCVACGEQTGYPTICKGRYNTAHKQAYYPFEEPISLNLTRLLPDLTRGGGSQRSKSKAGKDHVLT